MEIPIYTSVTLVTNKYANLGVKKGDYGVIIEIYEDGYEVEFLDGEGNTLNTFGVEKLEVEKNANTKLFRN